MSISYLILICRISEISKISLNYMNNLVKSIGGETDQKSKNARFLVHNLISRAVVSSADTMVIFIKNCFQHHKEVRA